jgi:hypothetical protein
MAYFVCYFIVLPGPQVSQPEENLNAESCHAEHASEPHLSMQQDESQQNEIPQDENRSSTFTNLQEMQDPVPLPKLPQLLETANEENKLATFYLEFVKFHGEHLYSHYPFPTKATYGNYAKSIIERYPIFRDETELLASSKKKLFHG